jgi:hypothetical protein
MVVGEFRKRNFIKKKDKLETNEPITTMYIHNEEVVKQSILSWLRLPTDLIKYEIFPYLDHINRFDIDEDFQLTLGTKPLSEIETNLYSYKIHQKMKYTRFPMVLSATSSIKEIVNTKYKKSGMQLYFSFYDYKRRCKEVIHKVIQSGIDSPYWPDHNTIWIPTSKKYAYMKVKLCLIEYERDQNNKLIYNWIVKYKKLYRLI